MFDSVLVANRGEIALRIYRACHDLGVRAIAVYSEADRNAPWLRAADDAYLLGPAPAAQSYLHLERLLEVAHRSGAQAVHPGYGFLSERADAAAAITESGLVWIGPPASAIERMGDKLSARATALTADCPVVPGTMEPTDDPRVVEAFAEEHGLPVAIKAAYGGGGRGLKVVHDRAGLADGLEAAAREATAAFGRGEVYVERYLPRARHLEIQVLADSSGTVLSLGERDCSTQRRHQKLIEEAPAPHLAPAVREAMSAAAVRVTREVDYVGAGTCEFLAAADDGADEFFFLEMNTRLQVEHPVTELVTGVDLVHWQLRIAAGEPLDLTPAEVAPRGHAIEVRVNAEDVAAGFVPTAGRITRWVPPAGPGVRLDAAGADGWEVPGAYDSLLAKVVAYGSDRETARRVLLRACEEMVVEGVPTTLDFHRFALVHPDLVEGRVSTVSVEQEWDLAQIPAAGPSTAGEPAPDPLPVVVEVDGRRVEVVLHGALAESGTGRGAAGGPVRRRRPRSGASPGRIGGAVVAPMQGTIVKVAVEAGQAVASGDPLVVLEAMKMENVLTADGEGTVTAVHVDVSDVVNVGDVLVEVTDAPVVDG